MVATENLRRSQRNAVKTTVFAFSPNHKTAATRIKQCRDRQRIFFAVRKTRGMSDGQETQAAEVQPQAVVAQPQAVEDQPQAVEDQPQTAESLPLDNQAVENENIENQPQKKKKKKQEEFIMGQGAKRSLGFSKPNPKLIVKFGWNK